MRLLVPVALCLLAGCTSTTIPDLAPADTGPTGSKASLRGVAIVGDVIWATGSNGAVLRSADAGRTFSAIAVPGAESLGVRDIEALDSRRAWILTIGAGAASRIYFTADAGMSWTEQYRGRDSKGFLDGLAFFDDRRGLAYGDPVDGDFEILRTTNGGAAWSRVPGDAIPDALSGEAGFAASGTGIAVWGDRHAWICTGGGGRSRVLRSDDAGRTWAVATTTLDASKSSSGGFSIAFRDARHGVLVGGDYQAREVPASTASRTDDGGRTWHAAHSMPRGQRACVAWVGGRTWIAVGATGGDISHDDGRSWRPWIDEGFFTIDVDGPRRAAAAGSDGRITRFLPRR